MKNITLLAFLGLSVVLISGCMDKSPNTMPTETMTGTETTANADSTKEYSLSHVASHNTESDCRTAINGTIYDVTAFFGKHPGGDKNLFRTCGIDATEVFNGKHGNDPKANNVLAGFEIGTLVK